MIRDAAALINGTLTRFHLHDAKREDPDVSSPSRYIITPHPETGSTTINSCALPSCQQSARLSSSSTKTTFVYQILTLLHRFSRLPTLHATQLTISLPHDALRAIELEAMFVC